MNKNIKRIFLFTTVLMLLATVTALSAADTNDNSTAVSSDIQQVSHDTSTVEKTVQTYDNKNTIEQSQKAIKKDGTTHVVNNDNVDEIFSGEGYGLADSISEGDTLDFQGLIDRNHSIIIDKPVNTKSSTNDAFISLHTKAGSLMGEDPGNSFVVNIGASGSNITGLYLNNTECWIHNVYNAVLYNMTMHVQNAQVGSGVGQTSLRYCNNVTMDSCTIYTENNGGSSSFVWTGCNNCTIINSTVQAEGYVGNLLYVGNPFNVNDKPANYTITNFDNRVINCTINGGSGGISNPLQNGGQRTYVEGNKFYCGGSVGAAAYGVTGATATYVANEFYRTCGLSVPANCEARDNVFYGNGTASIAANAKVHNNSFYRATISGANVEFVGNNVTNLLTVSQPIQLENSNLGSITLNTNAKNSNITNNNISGLVTVNAANVTITDNTINTTGETAVSVSTDGVVVANNTIYSAAKAGDKAVTTTKTTTVIEGNQPESKTFTITDDTYSQYFGNDSKLINPEVTSYSTIILDGPFNNKSFIFTNVSVEIDGNDAVLNDGQILVTDQAKAIINNITFNNTNIDSSVIFETESNILRNSRIIKNFTTSFAREVVLIDDNNKVEYNTIEITGPSSAINYSAELKISPVIGVAVLSSSNTVQYNNITYTDTGSSTDGSTDLITISGVSGAAENNLVTRNNLNAVGNGYLYGLSLGVNANNNNLTYNTMNISSSYYAYGVNILQVPMTNNGILYNTINLKANNTAYGVLANVWGEPEAANFRINNNNINVEAENAFGAQIGGSEYSEIVFKNVNFTTNTINVTGKYAMGIGLFYTNNIILNRNTFIINGQTNETNTASWDYVKPTTVGVYSENGNITRVSNDIRYTVTNGPNVIYKNVNVGQITSGAFTSDNVNFILENVENVNITSTNANTTADTSVELINSNNNIVRNNVFRAANVGGNDAVTADENSTENVIESNNPMIKLLTEDTYASLFDENSTYTNTEYNTLQLGSDLYNKDLKFTDGISIENTGNYTIYNGTIYLEDTEGVNYKNTTINITGINFNNVNKSVIVDDLTNSQRRNVYFYNGDITIIGDDVVVFDSQKDVVTYVYINAEHNSITINATNAAVAKMIRPINNNLDDYVDFENNIVNINAEENASILTVVGSDVDFINNKVDITAKDALLVSSIDAASSNFFYSGNNATITADNITALILINNGGSNPSVGNNTFIFTSSNPVKAIYSENCTNVFVGQGRTTSASMNRPNKFYINATNGEVPVIETLGQNNSVRGNTIITNDIYGDDAVVAEVVSNNLPFITNVVITAPESVKTGDVVTVSAQATNKTGTAVTGNLVMKIDDEIVAESESSSISYTFTIENANTTVSVEYTNTSTRYGPSSNQTSLLNTKATIVEVDDIQAVAGENLTVSATFKDVYGNDINGGKAILKINGVTLKDENGKVIYVKVVDGVAQFENIEIPEKWAGKTLDIQVVYSGTSKYDSMRVNTTVTVESQETGMEFTTKDITAHRKDTITLSVKVNAQDGKVVFKVNGKTVKDANGKVVYAKVVDGIASVEYTVPNNFKFQTYNVTAAYLYKDERLEANTTLTIE